MADGINIKVLPEATSIGESDRILIDKNIIGTQVIPFSAIIVSGNQVTFYTDFVNLSAFSKSLSASTNAGFLQIESNLTTNLSFLSTQIESVSTNIINLSVNTTTFISGGVSPSGSIIPEKVGILYFAEDTKDYFLSINNVNDQDWRRILTVDYSFPPTPTPTPTNTPTPTETPTPTPTETPTPTPTPSAP